MSDLENWATSVVVAHRLLGRGATGSFDDARATVERLTGNVMLWPGPAEMFSEEMPAYVGPRAEEGTLPIDVLYGRYTPEGSRIDVFVNRIRADAPRLGVEFIDLLTVVRIHEYAHAIVHTGIVAEQLAALAGNPTTDWDSFRAGRHAAFCALDDESSELLAQAITWGCVSQEPNSQRCQRLGETYLALEDRQPKRYQLPPGVTQRSPLANWRLILQTAQGEPDVYRTRSFRLVDGFAELIRKTAEPKTPVEMWLHNPLAVVASGLQQELASAGPAPPKTDPGQNRLELLVARKECIELRMYKEAAHRRPHFHVEFKSEFEASYALDTLDRLAGYMPRKYEEVILRVARANRDQLAEFWSSLNGSARVAVAGEPP